MSLPCETLPAPMTGLIASLHTPLSASVGGSSNYFVLIYSENLWISLGEGGPATIVCRRNRSMPDTPPIAETELDPTDPYAREAQIFPRLTREMTARIIQRRAGRRLGPDRNARPS